MNASVSVCIPAYQSGSFIDRTLSCARAQTHENIRIIVSVDLSDDNTVEICKRHAREDSRINIIIQKERLGWSKNANAVLDCSDTELFFLYFHDDVIEPTYVEALLRALTDRPDAASAHCDLIEFGLLEEIKPANTYDGSPFHRLIEFMMTQRGTTLRSLVRSNAVSNNLRFPNIHGDNHWSARVFHMKLLAAGPAIGVHEQLYRRWQREGSLTRSKIWQSKSIESLLRGQQQSVELCLEILDQAATTPDEQITGRYCLRLFQLLFTRTQQLRLKNYEFISSSEISDSLDPELLSLKPEVLDPKAKEWIKQAEVKLQMLDRNILLAKEHY